MFKVFKNIVISAFDENFMEYAVPMYQSVKRFHPNLPLFAASLGLSSPSTKMLEDMGVTVLQSKTGFIPDHLCLCDLTLKDYLNFNWKSLMWIDADTLMLRPFDHLFNLPYDFIGHGGNIEEGTFEFAPPRSFLKRERVNGTLIETNRWGRHYAMGLWVARNPSIIDDFYELAVTHKEFWYEGDICSELINKKYHHHQLDGYLWSLGSYHDLKYKDGQLVHHWQGSVHRPYQVGFSRMQDGSRVTSKAIEAFYEEQISRLPSEIQDAT